MYLLSRGDNSFSKHSYIWVQNFTVVTAINFCYSPGDVPIALPKSYEIEFMNGIECNMYKL